MSQRRTALKSFQASTLTKSKIKLQHDIRSIITTRTKRSKQVGDINPGAKITSKISNDTKKCSKKIDKKSQAHNIERKIPRYSVSEKIYIGIDNETLPTEKETSICGKEIKEYTTETPYGKIGKHYSLRNRIANKIGQNSSSANRPKTKSSMQLNGRLINGDRKDSEGNIATAKSVCEESKNISCINNKISDVIANNEKTYLFEFDTPSQEMEYISPTKPKNTLKEKNDEFLKMVDVDLLLQNIGVVRTSKVSLCLKAAIFNGYIKLKENVSDLNIVVHSTEAEDFCPCGKTFVATLGNLMYQPDAAGYDREDLSLATVRCDCADNCTNKDCDINSLYPSPHAIYVTSICNGNPSVTTGQFHNHCDECPNFGICIGDYRESHCLTCHEHFFKSGRDAVCPNCP